MHAQTGPVTSNQCIVILRKSGAMLHRRTQAATTITKYFIGSNPGAFAFSKSEWLPHHNIEQWFRDWLENAPKFHLENGEKERYVILVV